MDLYEARDMALPLIREYAPGWHLSWNNKKTVLGQTFYRDRIIRLSKPLTLINGIAVMEDVVRHECAHVIAGPSAHHGERWKAVCRRIGARPLPYAVDSEALRGPWALLCPGCGRLWQRHREPKKMYRCPPCGTSLRIIDQRQGV